MSSNQAISRKVRTGCLTCKMRRVKCDEQKPHCNKCVKTGRQCSGYSLQPTASAQRASRLAPPDASAPLNLSIRRLDVTLPGTSIERRNFDYFQDRTASDLAGAFDSKFWFQVVLQMSHSEPAVRHAVVALGSLHETLDKSGHVFGQRSLPTAEREFSLQQYSKSMTSLTELMTLEEESSILETALICCILFNSFETLQGNHDQALIHLQNGLKILHEWRTTRNQSLFMPEPSSAQYELSQVFSRLNVQARSLLDPVLPPFHDLSENLCSSTVPDDFTNLMQARDILYTVYNDGFSFYQRMAEQMRSETSPHSLNAAETFSPLAEYGRLQSHLFKWLSAFDRFVERSALTMDSRELRGATLLRIHYLCVFIVLHKSIQSEQCAFDTYNCYFDQMVSLSSTLMHSSGGPNPNSPKPGFSLDLGIIAPLYYTAISCRDPKVRRRAVSVLSSPRHEGAWSAIDAAQVGSLAIQIEEEGLGEIHSSADVPESSRLSEINTTGSDGDRICLRCVFSGKTSPKEPTVKEIWLDSCVYVKNSFR